jgi:hypothetical protein
MVYKVGIYDSEITARFYSRKKCVLTVPTVKWTGQTGSLDFYKVTVDSSIDVSVLREMFETDSWIVDRRNHHDRATGPGPEYVNLPDIIERHETHPKGV